MSTVVDKPTTDAPNIDVKSPVTGEVMYQIQDITEDQVGDIYARAHDAHQRVSSMTVAQRVAEVTKLKKWILEHKEEIIDKICAETGKSRTDALISEIFNTVDALQYYEQNAEKHLAPQKVPTPIILFPKKSKVYFEPIGPVLVISPWNYPFNLTVIPLVCAFVAGNSVVFKPSEYTPLHGLLEKMCEDTGFPKDAFQVIYGGKDTGRRLIDGKPAKIFFTGSTRAGREIMKQAADYLIPVELELGGKDPFIVFDDVNLDRTVNGAIWGGMSNCGQTCTAVERAIVHEKIYPEFVEKLKAKLENLSSATKQRDPSDSLSLDVGVMTTEFQVEKVQELVEDAISNGATVLVGGKRGEGHQFEPTVLTDVTPEMRIVKEETFGPVITVQKFSSENEAVALANDSIYGLSASVWSADLDRADRIARQIVTGNVSINNVLATQGNSALPYGGTKESGFGRYKGSFGLHAFSNVKSVLVDKQGSMLELNWYPYSKEKYALFSKLIDTVYGGAPFALVKAIGIGAKLQKLSKKKHL